MLPALSVPILSLIIVHWKYPLLSIVTPSKFIHHRFVFQAFHPSIQTQSHPVLYQIVLLIHAVVGERYIQPKLVDQAFPVTFVSDTFTLLFVVLKFIHQIDSHHAHFSVVSIGAAKVEPIESITRKHHRVKLNIFVYSFIVMYVIDY